ncbi:MAG: hypothetical protein CL963_01980 [Euryarchaeota archaeon]|jgi:vacuolar-type H+-ATPase subunit H|nr:hypothetical protein [Euryarchaeota archaeon]HIK01123.1 hypothetical protein [Candidatus Undinarchaeales archaeon ERR594346 U_76725]|tara:strand:- start:19591 stop:19908 length:318 start_codon:yes stop_codon:yes gene_type:complete
MGKEDIIKRINRIEQEGFDKISSAEARKDMKLTEAGKYASGLLEKFNENSVTYVQERIDTERKNQMKRARKSVSVAEKKAAKLEESAKKKMTKAVDYIFKEFTRV